MNLDPRQQPQAPEPKWEKPVKPFNRERFLLLLVAWILGVQFSLLILAGFICGYGQIRNFHRPGPDEQLSVACPGIMQKIKDSAAESLAVLLALLGGGTLAVGDYQRRHPPSREPEDVPPQWRPPAPGPDPRSLDPRDPRHPGN